MKVEVLKNAITRFAKTELAGYNPAEKRAILGTVAGYLIAMNTNLPTSPVTGIVNYYLASHEPTTVNLMDRVNECEFIDTRLGLEVARNVYMLRYNIVFDSETMLKLGAVLFGGTVATLPTNVNALLNKVGFDKLAVAGTLCF